MKENIEANKNEIERMKQDIEQKSIEYDIMQGKKKKVRESGLKKGSASPGALAAASEFLQRIERYRKNYEPDTTPLTPLREKLVEQIEHAFAGVQCLNEPYVLLCGEALQSQVKMKISTSS